MAVYRDFETYFGNRSAASGPQPATGDELLILRSGSVLRIPAVNNVGLMYLSANATATTISAVDTWTTIGGTFTEGDHAAVHTFASNQFTYAGPNQEYHATISARATLLQSGAATEDYEIGVFVNSTLVANSMRVTADQDKYVFVACDVLHQLTTGDVIEMKVRSRVGSEDVIVTDAQLLIAGGQT